MKPKEINTVDLFCGAGGASTGLELALERLGYKHRGIAINHWRVAVDTMKANHPSIDTKQMSIEEAVPADLVPGGRVDFLWASPSCTHHSRAKGGKPRSNQLRAQPELILTWLDQLFVRRLIVENVPEFVEWGPLSASGKPIAAKKGACFQKWVEAIEARNYHVEWRILNCANYGDATTRKRFFLQAVRKGCGHVVWPEPEYAEDPQPDLWGNTPKRWRGIRECLDLSDTGTSIFNRKRPLAENTLRRVFAGLRKFCGLDFQLDFLGADGPDDPRLHSTDEPLATQPAGGNRTALVRSYLVRFNNHADAESVEKPLSVVTAHAEHHALCTPIVLDHFKNGIAAPAENPVGAQTSHDRFSVVRAFVMNNNTNNVPRPLDKPMHAQTTGNHAALVQAFAVDLSHPGDPADGARISSGDDPMKTATARNNTAAAFVITEQANNAPRSIDEPIRSQTTIRKDFVVRPFVVGQNESSAPHSVDDPCPTITTTSRGIKVFTPLVLGQQGGAECIPADKPSPTIATKGAVRLVKLVPVAVVDMSRPAGHDSGHFTRGDKPIRTITSFDNVQGVFLMTEDGYIIDVRMRMLKPSELAAAHSFPKDYKLAGNRSEQVKQIGNSVPVRTAAALCQAALCAA